MPFDFQPAVVRKLRTRNGQEVDVPQSLPPTGWRLEGNKIQCNGVLVQGSGEVDCVWKDNEVAGVRSVEDLGRPFSREAMRLHPTPLFKQLSDGTWADDSATPLVHPGVKKEATGPEASHPPRAAALGDPNLLGSALLRRLKLPRPAHR